MVTATDSKDRFSLLSNPSQCLLRLLQVTNFGRITFHIRSGEPDVGRPWHTRRTVKLAGGENGPRPEATRADFELRKEHTALLEHLASLSDGVRVAVEVRHGLPFLVEIEQDHQAA